MEKKAETAAIHETTPDGEKILQQVDRESQYRRNFQPMWKYLIWGLSIIFIVYHMWTSRFGMPEIIKHRAIHVSFILGLVWLYFPATRTSPRDRPSVFDIALFLVTLAVSVYTILNRDAFLLRGGVANTADYIAGAAMMLLVLESCRRAVGPQLLILCVVFILYAWGGRYIPGVLSHRGHTVQRIIYQMYLTGQGIFGMPIGVSSTYLIIFVVLGAMLDKSGLSKLFNDLALAGAGRLTGGPAKVSVVAVGPVGSGGEVDARETLAAYGLTYDDMRVSFVEFAQAIDMMKDGLVDAGIIGVALGASSMQELMLDGKAVMIPISDEALANLRKKNEFLIRRVIPKNVYPNQDYEVPTVGTPPDIIIVRDDMPEDLVYKMTKTLYTNLPAIHAVSALLTQFGRDLVLPEDQMLIPYHPGAKKYFVEMGWLTN